MLVMDSLCWILGTLLSLFYLRLVSIVPLLILLPHLPPPEDLMTFSNIDMDFYTGLGHTLFITIENQASPRSASL